MRDRRIKNTIIIIDKHKFYASYASLLKMSKLLWQVLFNVWTCRKTSRRNKERGRVCWRCWSQTMAGMYIYVSCIVVLNNINSIKCCKHSALVLVILISKYLSAILTHINDMEKYCGLNVHPTHQMFPESFTISTAKGELGC